MSTTQAFGLAAIALILIYAWLIAQIIVERKKQNTNSLEGEK
ncbi:hypothetical protein SEA_MEDIUMFRY_50 [Arthrobacter phage MediumFry]|nr:hypothetical protein SEA_MEDIUMFRY_50 [Arthrobacter phage MediumFry]